MNTNQETTMTDAESERLFGCPASDLTATLTPERLALAQELGLQVRTKYEGRLLRSLRELSAQTPPTGAAIRAEFVAKKVIVDGWIVSLTDKGVV